MKQYCYNCKHCECDGSDEPCKTCLEDGLYIGDIDVWVRNKWEDKEDEGS